MRKLKQLQKVFFAGPLKIKKDGLTLAELLLTVFVLSVGILSTVLFFTTVMQSTQYASDITEATSHAEYVFEEMRTRSTLANITSTDWPVWAASQGFVTLPSEDISVDIVDPAADPLVIHITVSWVRNSRQNNIVLSTEITK